MAGVPRQDRRPRCRAVEGLVGGRGDAGPAALEGGPGGRRLGVPRGSRRRLMTRLRLMTYNILLAGRRGDPLHQVVRSVAPDVLLVNECPKNPLVWRRGCRRLAARWDLRYVVGGRPAGSNMIAVGPGVAVKSVPQQTLRQPRLQPRRGIAAAQLRVGG